MTNGFQLTRRAKGWARGIKAQYSSGRGTENAIAEGARIAAGTHFKML
jgi:hypothetical protein